MLLDSSAIPMPASGFQGQEDPCSQSAQYRWCQAFWGTRLRYSNLISRFQDRYFLRDLLWKTFLWKVCSIFLVLFYQLFLLFVCKMPDWLEKPKETQLLVWDCIPFVLKNLDRQRTLYHRLSMRSQQYLWKWRFFFLEFPWSFYQEPTQKSFAIVMVAVNCREAQPAFYLRHLLTWQRLLW